MKLYRIVLCLLLVAVLAIPAAAAESYTRYEAEKVASYGNYYAGDNRMINEYWALVYKTDMTFDKLDSQTVRNVPWVCYTLNVPKSGIYTIQFGFLSGGTCPDKNVFFGLQVNDEAFQKAEYTLDTTSYQHCVTMELNLQQGENRITVTGVLKDHMNYPNFPSQSGGTGLWIDHDYILVPEEVEVLIADRVESWTGDEESDVDISPEDVWFPENPPAGIVSGTVTTPAEQKTPMPGWIWLLILGGAALVVEAFFFLRMMTKKKAS